MWRYIVRRLLQTIPILFGVSILIFLFVRMIPGDPARLLAGPQATLEEIQAVREDLGLDKPPVTQYLDYFGKALTGNFGKSMRTRVPVTEEIGLRLMPTVSLAVVSMVIAIAIGLSAGILSAVKRNTWMDYLSMTGALAGVSLPSFWLALMLMYLLAVKWRLLPTFGYGSWRHFVMPAITLGVGAAAAIARFTRAAMLEVLSQDYIRTARAKGLPEPKVNLLHALKNALIPVVTITGLQFGFLLGGTVVVESVFAWPGLGRLLVDVVESRDYPVIQTLMLFFSLTFVVINLAVDVLYAVIDPRISYE
ncbi:MAG TPA: nickel ABC transporter permease [Symbiobacteriaceae bacterium]|nr:nickel ABC transporter permease [Symbiobacteriaceae bacterium]